MPIHVIMFTLNNEEFEIFNCEEHDLLNACKAFFCAI